MFKIETTQEGEIRLLGRLDAAAAHQLESALQQIHSSAVIDFDKLDYISSSGLGELFAAQKRLQDQTPPQALALKNLNAHIREVFAIAGFDAFFDIE